MTDQPLDAVTRPVPELQDTYVLRAIQWCEQPLRIVTQNENGPCPLISIANVLLLRNQITLPFEMTEVTSRTLVSHIADYMFKIMPSHLNEAQVTNYQKNMSDAMDIFPKLQTGLDVNIKFSGPTAFEFTPELAVFDLLNIRLLHGWLPDPASEEHIALQDLSYNQAVDRAITCADSPPGFVIRSFLDASASQLTLYGIAALKEAVGEGEIVVFFRNNHFNTLLKRDGTLHLLLTDQGFRFETVVWQQLVDVADAGLFLDANFCAPVPHAEVVVPVLPDNPDAPVQAHADETDLELARRLQEEEDMRHAQRLQQEEDARERERQRQQEGRAQAQPPPMQQQPQSQQQPRQQQSQPRRQQPQPQRQQESNNSCSIF